MFLNYYLTRETLEEIQTPNHLAKDYDDMTGEERKEFYEYCFHKLLGMAGLEICKMLGRRLRIVELNLVKRRILDFFKQAGIEKEDS